MARYFRCKDPNKQCEHARTGEVLLDQPGVCPEQKKDCERHREPVPWREAMLARHPRRVWVGLTAMLGFGLIVFLLTWSWGGGSSDLDQFNQALQRLDGELAALQARPISVRTPPGVDDWEQLHRQALDLQRETASVTGAAAQAELPRLRSELGRLEQTQARLQQTALPDPEVADEALDAQALVRSFETLEEQVDTAYDAVDLFDEAADLAYADLQEQLRDSMDRARALAKPQSAPVQMVPRAVVEGTISALSATRSALAGLADRPTPEAAGLRIKTRPELVESLLLPLLLSHLDGHWLGEIEPQRWYLSVPDGPVAPGVDISTNDEAPYLSLIDGTTDLVLTDQPPSASESTLFATTFAGHELTSTDSSEVVALDAILLLAGANAPQTPVTAAGLGEARWLVYAADAGAIARHVGDAPVLEPVDAPVPQLAGSAARAMVFYHHCAQDRCPSPLAYQPDDAARASTPAPFSIATEDYGLSFRIIAAHSPLSRPTVRAFIDLLTSDAGRERISAAGFVDPNSVIPDPETVNPIVLATLGKALGRDPIPSRNATRYSTNLHFGVDEDSLDIKAQASLDRLPTALKQAFPEAEVVILGFTDNSGDPGYNWKLALRRAKGISARLRAEGVYAVPAGLGEQLPVDTNDTEQGRARNRRTEIWVVR